MTLYKRKPHALGFSIVPMLDILTILLIFFIVQTEFKRQVSVLDIAVPRTRTLAGTIGNRNDILLELADDGSLAVGGERVASDKLAEKVRALREKNPEAKFQLAGAEGASMGSFIFVLDTLSEAGLDLDDVPVRIAPEP